MRTIRQIDLEDAEIIASSVISAAQANGTQVSVAVVDAAGGVIMSKRMDGAPVGTFAAALEKAVTAAQHGLRTDELAALLKEDHPGLATLPSAVAVGGGVPILEAGECLGAIGVSGAPIESDIAFADAAARAILPQLQAS